MGIQYPITPAFITERQWHITGIETPVMFVHRERPYLCRILPSGCVVCTQGRLRSRHITCRPLVFPWNSLSIVYYLPRICIIILHSL